MLDYIVTIAMDGIGELCPVIGLLTDLAEMLRVEGGGADAGSKTDGSAGR